MDVEGRIQRAVEGILENEKLTADLDDDAAQVLLDWGTRCARQIAQGTLGLNDAQAEEDMYQPMRATRRMMRAVNKLASRHQILGDEGCSVALQKIIAQAGLVYGRDYIPPDSTRQNDFLANIQLTTDIPGIISQIRTLVENETPTSSYGV